MNEIESRIYRFICQKTKPIKREDTKMQWDKGGMNMPDVKAAWKEYKISWILRLVDCKGTWVVLFREAMKPRFLFRNIQSTLTNLDLIYLSKNLKYIRSDFWKEVFKELPDLVMQYVNKNKAQGLMTNIWGLAIKTKTMNR